MKRVLPFHSNAVWPPASMVGAFIVIYAVIELGLSLIQLALPVMAGVRELQEIKNMRAVMLGVAAAWYAVYRLWRFHPACNREYAGWLSLSPWTAARPLPLGPIHLVWQDLAIVGALTLIAGFHAHVDPAIPGVAFGLIYLGGLTCLLAVTRQWPAWVALGFLWPTLALPGAAGWPAVGIGGALILVLWHGQRQSLRAFPWGFLDHARSKGTGGESILHKEIHVEGVTNPANGKSFSVGWPLVALTPKLVKEPVRLSSGFWISALVGWWMFCASARINSDPLSPLVLLFAVLAAMLRLVLYSGTVVPPFNVWGRIATGRIIVPGFDRVFVTPMAAVLVAILGSIIVGHCGSWFRVAESCVMAAVCFVLITGGPTLRNWLLTGHHRYRLPARFRSKTRAARAGSFQMTG